MKVSLSPSSHISDILEADEQALRHGDPAISVATCQGRGVTLGVSQDLGTGEAERARSIGLSVCKRSSGGVGLLHEPGDVFWSIVLPRSAQVVGRDFVHAYPRLGAGVVSFLGEKGIEASWTAAPGMSPVYCLLSERGYVLTSGGRAIGGASQHLTASSILHHGVLACTLNPGDITRIFGLTRVEVQQGLASLKEFGLYLSERDLRDLAENLRDSVSPGA